MFNLIGELNNNINSSKEIVININEINEGINYYEENIIVKKNGHIKVFNRTCDHAGGKIISFDGEHVCPIHKWKFDPVAGKYFNGVIKKEESYTVDKLNNLIIKNFTLVPEITKINKENDLKVRFFNHAFLTVESKDFKFATDPWAIGPAFNTGWWLRKKTKLDWIEQLNSCNFIYISHNHPDHLHPLTLSKIRKDINIIVANFSSDSTGKYLESLGFNNVVRLDFAKEYNLINTNLVISLLKSGDFRDDSGIYFSYGNFTGLFDVDSNMINFNKVPKVDLYASSFAGGASGYPIMFDNYNSKEKIKIINNKKNFIKSQNLKMIKRINPKFFLPYAGFFKEKLLRDKTVYNMNIKNSIKDYLNFCHKNNIQLLDVDANDEFIFSNKNLVSKKNIKKNYFYDIKPNDYLKYFKQQYKNIDTDYIKKYFVNSKFNDQLVLFISLTNDSFKNNEFNFKVDFRNKKIVFQVLKKKIDFKEINGSIKKLHLSCRKESFLNTIYNKLPWEDLLIGFQCRVKRSPNIYNHKFWYHFTNIYITHKHIRFTSNCNVCEKIETFFDNQYLKVNEI
jgi:CMP-N-acetylneuraminate monooxygenase